MTTSILDIAREDGDRLAKNSLAVRIKGPAAKKKKTLKAVTNYFTRNRFRELYRAHVLRSRRRSCSDRECDLAYHEAVEKADGQANQVQA